MFVAARTKADAHQPGHASSSGEYAYEIYEAVNDCLGIVVDDLLAGGESSELIGGHALKGEVMGTGGVEPAKNVALGIQLAPFQDGNVLSIAILNFCFL